MRKLFLPSLALASFIVFNGTALLAQPYSNAVVALNPVAYWPLTETTQPPAGQYVATNSGTLGAVGNGFYETWWQTNGTTQVLFNTNNISHVAGATADGDQAMGTAAVGQYVVFPRFTNGVANSALTIQPPFSIELWVKPTSTTSSLFPIVTEGFNNIQTGANLNYQTTQQGVGVGQFGGNIYFVTFNGGGTKTEADAVFTVSQWNHIVCTFDGTNQNIYLNGALKQTKVPPRNALGQVFVADLLSPLLIGGGTELGASGGGNPFPGSVDEVAIYTNVLALTAMTNHFQTAYGTNGTFGSNYKNAVLANNPTVYMRLDEPAFTGAPDPSTYPVANNYGSLGVAAKGVYQPGTVPGVAGPTNTGFGSPSFGVAINGFNAGVDVGGGSLPPALNPTNNQPVTVAAWFRANPADCVGRFQAIVGHSDASWRLSLDNNAGNRFNPGNGPEMQFANVYDELANGMFLNDGNWHFAVGVSDGTNDSLYLDGLLAKSGTGVGSVTGSLRDVILGGDPQYTAPQISGGGGGRFFDGNIAQVAVFTNALTPAQIQGIYTAAGNLPPVIRIQPVSQTAFTGQAATFTAAASGASTLSYLWYKNGSALPTQTSASLSLNPVGGGDAAPYYVVVTNSYGAVTSSVVQLTVSPATSSTYATAVRNLNPAAYWPLNETTQPPFGTYIATNIGTAGAAGNGYYETWFQPGTGAFGQTTYFQTNNIQHVPGAIGDSDTAMLCNRTLGSGQYVVFPRATNGVANQAITLTPPFAIELWVKAFSNTNSTVMPIVTEGRNPALDSTYATTNESGFSLGQFGTILYFATWNNRGGDSTKTERDVLAMTNGWEHVVVNFNGTTMTWFTNGVQGPSATVSTANSAGQFYTVDMTSPLLIGTGSIPAAGNGASEWLGGVDEVAIYTNLLQLSDIQNHFSLASATDNSYQTAVLANNPSIYVRLGEPAMSTASYPNPNTYPAANNYGSIGAAANGAYQPGTAPGSAGPPFAGFGGSSYAVAINGFSGAVDVGNGNLPYQLNPLGNQPQTVAAWIQTSPADAPARFQGIVGHGGASWRMALDNYSGGMRFNPGNNPEIQFTSAPDVLASGAVVNDGNWHFVAGVSDGSTESLYIDGVLIRSSNSVAAISGSFGDALLGGDPSTLAPVFNGTTGSSPRYFDGKIAHVSYFTNALNATNIQQLYNIAGVPPLITQQPIPLLATNAGVNITIPVSLNRAATPLSYRWYGTNGVFVPGETNLNLVFNPIALSNAGSYYLIVTNLYGAATSTVVQITVVGPPIVQQQSLTDVKVFAGTTPVLNVTCAGSPPLSFQWRSNGVPIAGATSSSYRVTGTAAPGTNIYTCVITNAFSLSNPTTNTPISVAVLPDPMAPYPVAVLADAPSSYFRLDEPNFFADGTVAYDYAGGYNAIYTNASTGQAGYSSLFSPNTDPFETAVAFGQSTLNNSFAGNAPTYLDFATNGGNAQFSVEAWVNAPFGASTDAGIVTLGYGFGGEQFNLDVGGRSGSTHTYRFTVTDSNGLSHNASTQIAPGDGLWHHLVGVCDEAGGHVYLYVDGVLSGSGTVAANAGIRTFSSPLSIGSRMGTAGDSSFTNQFQGTIDDVAIYKTALSQAQILNHYYAAGIAPVVTGLTPTNQISANENTTVQMTVAASGTPALSYQWLDNLNNPIPWGTNATLTLTNVIASQAGTYTVNVSNPYGTASTNALLMINTGSPTITVDLQPTNATVYAGTLFTYTVTVSGSGPFTYVWTRNGSTIAGATDSTYTFGALQGTNNYQVTVSNATPPPTNSAVARLVGFPSPVLNPLSFANKAKITFAGYNRSETLLDFPVLVRLGTNVPGYASSQFASPTGGDLRFTSANGTNEIPYEIDEWNPTAVSSVWVQVPSLSSNTFIWAYWGNPAATTPPTYSTDGEVWVPPSFVGLPQYEIVYHLKEGALPFADSTLNFPATNGVAPAATPGVVGQGGAFTGTEWLDAGTVNLGDAFTLSVWADVNPSVSDIQTIWANQLGGSGNAGFAFGVNTFQAFNQKMYFASGDGTHLAGRGLETSTAANVVTFGQWHLLDASINRTNGTVVFSVDGFPVFSGAVVSYFTNQADLNFGRFDTGPFYMHGAMDEARIRQSTSSTNWIWAEYMTVASNTPFSSYSSVTSSIVTLHAQLLAGNLVLTWSQGTLQAAGQVGGTYTNISSATSPYTNAPSGPQRFFRVLVQ